MKIKTSRIILLPSFLILLPLTFISFFLFLIIFISIVIFFEIYRIYRYVEIKKDEILEKVGIIKVNLKKVKIDDIISIKVVQGPIARIFNYGDVVFKTVSDELVIKYVYNPRNFLKVKEL